MQRQTKTLPVSERTFRIDVNRRGGLSGMYYVHCDANAVALSGGNDVLLEKIRLAFDFMADEGAHDVKVKEVLGLKFVRTIQ